MGPIGADAATRSSLPPLQNGDCLTGEEFDRRYAAMGEGCKAELIDGVVYLRRWSGHAGPIDGWGVMGPPTGEDHASEHAALSGWLFTYAVATPGVKHTIEATVVLDDASRPEPDLCLMLLPRAGGRLHRNQDGFLEGTPELAIEIAASSAAYDLHQKKAIYLRKGIPEYLVFSLHAKEILWFTLEGGAYVLLPPDERGVLRSRIFPGLWLDTRAISSGDTVQLVETLRAGLSTNAHADFVATLRARMASAPRE
jgi:Uma2 family endonuclease